MCILYHHTIILIILHTLSIEGIDESVTEDIIRNTFLKYGDITRVIISPEHDMALVTFRDIATASACKGEFVGGLGTADRVRLHFGSKDSTVVDATMMDQVADTTERRAKYAKPSAMGYQVPDFVQTEASGPRLPKV